MGTPTFASTVLEKIAESEFGSGIVGVVTTPDAPKDRGHKLTPSPVKTAAERLGLPVFQPETLKGGAFEKEIADLAPDVIIVAAYGKILPKYILDAPKKYGCVNVHGSLLPKYRGAAPVQRAIMAGENEIGVTIMQMDEGLDTGDMILKRSLTFTDEPFGVIYGELARIGGDAMVETLRALENGTAQRTKQDDSLSTYASKIEKSDCAVDFSRRAKTTVDQIRALYPSPCATATLGEKTVKFAKAAALDEDASGENGEITAVSAKGDGFIDVKTGGGTLRVLRLVPEGKKEMSAGDFVRGRGCAVGDRFGQEKK